MTDDEQKKLDKKHYNKLRKEQSPKIAYEFYLKTRWWRTRRLEALEFGGHKCRKCQTRVDLQINHLRYNNLWNEATKDLEILCRTCHKEYHALLEEKLKLTNATRKRSKKKLETYTKRPKGVSTSKWKRIRQTKEEREFRRKYEERQLPRGQRPKMKKEFHRRFRK